MRGMRPLLTWYKWEREGRRLLILVICSFCELSVLENTSVVPIYLKLLRHCDCDERIRYLFQPLADVAAQRMKNEVEIV